MTRQELRRWLYWGLVGSLEGFTDDAVQQCDYCQATVVVDRVPELGHGKRCGRPQ